MAMRKKDPTGQRKSYGAVRDVFDVGKCPLKCGQMVNEWGVPPLSPEKEADLSYIFLEDKERARANNNARAELEAEGMLDCIQKFNTRCVELYAQTPRVIQREEASRIGVQSDRAIAAKKERRQEFLRKHGDITAGHKYG